MCVSIVMRFPLMPISTRIPSISILIRVPVHYHDMFCKLYPFHVLETESHYISWCKDYFACCLILEAHLLETCPLLYRIVLC